MESNKINPFAVQTPEDMSAKDANQIFVDVFTDFYHIPKPGHTFVNGARGTGKSMMFRIMLPDCQSLYHNKQIKELDYLALYVPIKKTYVNIVELKRLQKHADFMLNEHLLCTYIGARVFEYINEKLVIEETDTNLNSVIDYYNEVFIPYLIHAGYSGNIPSMYDELLVGNVIIQMQDLCDHANREVFDYVKKMSFTQDIPIYAGTICAYLDFLFPILKKMKDLPFFPNKAIYLLIDDADNLNYTQTMALNTWVSFRTSADISLKISTQLKYKTYKTFSGITIDTPHDYSEINISTMYTSTKGKYKERLTEIINRRLQSVGIIKNPFDFFPEDIKQKKSLDEISEKIRQEYSVVGKGYRQQDDVYRKARPDYIKSLTNRYNYKYAGFDQLVNISSGIIRYFLEPASLMFSEMQAISGGDKIEFIEPDIQNQQIREFSEAFLTNEFDRIELDAEGAVQASENYTKEGEGDELNQLDKLKNLIESLGGMFHLILLSDLSDRRVFSIALSDKPTKDLIKILKLGVRFGYLQEGTIGNKDGTGRTSMYVLSRRLAPYFTLDPNGFSAYKFITSQDLLEATMRPGHFLRKLKDKLKSAKNLDDDSQLTVFEL